MNEKMELYADICVNHNLIMSVLLFHNSNIHKAINMNFA